MRHEDRQREDMQDVQEELTLKLHVRVENWDAINDTYTHISQWELSKQQEKTLTSILRQLFEHPNTKYSSRLQKKESKNDL